MAMQIILERAGSSDLEAEIHAFRDSLVAGYDDLQAGIEDALAILQAFGRAPNSATWGAYWARSITGGPYLGLCGFKGPPDRNGTAEIAYCTFTKHRAQGVAQGMVAALIVLAKANDLRAIAAHTLPEESESTTVLKRTGFGFKGDVLDPDDGLVWAWRLDL